MRIYICADIEGVAGLSSRDQLRPEGGVEYQRARDVFTQEVAAAAQGALDAGCEEVVISDSHGQANNLKIEMLPRRTRLVRAWPRPLDMMQGIEDGEYAGCFFIGHHAGGYEQNGICAHTYSSAYFVEVRVNGEPVSETRNNAAIAGHFGAPTLLCTGDDVYVRHVRSFLDGVETVETKRALATYSASMRHPAEVREEIQAAAQRAVGRRNEVAPYRREGPLTLEILFTKRMPAEILSYLPQVERIGANTIRTECADMPAMAKFLHFVQAYQHAFA